MSEQQELREYRQGDTVRLTIEVQDENGIRSGFSQAFLEGGDEKDPNFYLDLSGWPEGTPTRAEIALEGAVEYQQPGVYECFVVGAENAYGAITHHRLDSPLRFRIVEHPDDVREGPKVLSVGAFW